MPEFRRAAKRIMETEALARTEARGWGLVTSLETSRGFSLTLTSKRSGFNGLSINRHGEVRKIEVKTVERSDDWFAINGFQAIEKLFLDREYWIYFALLPENIVLTTHAFPFLRKQVKHNDPGADLINELKEWLAVTRKLSKDFGLRFVPRINFHTRVPIRKMLQQTLENPANTEWQDVIGEIWRNDQAWKCLFTSPLERSDER